MDSRNLFLTVLKAGKSKIKALAWLDSGQGLLPGSCCVLTWQRDRGALWGLLGVRIQHVNFGGT